MHFYEATIKLRKPGDTSFTHEMPKRGLSAPEVLVLKHIHGDDAVVNIKPDGERNVGDRAEIERLSATYNGRTGDGVVVDVVRQVFGPMPQLPRQLNFLDEEPAAEVNVPAEAAPAAKPGTLTLPKK